MQVSQFNFIYPESCQKIFEIIQQHNGNVRFIGGCVRDFILHKQATDFDLATDLLPEKIVDIFTDSIFKVIPIGFEHGTILLTYKEYNFEITTIREDIECFGRHAKVKFTKDWKKDALRRDFTINALSIDLTDNLYDYTNGLDDLENLKVKFIGNPEQRISEDKLRMLRYFRFLSYFGLKNIDKPSMLACTKNFANLHEISAERKKVEFFKLLAGDYAYEVTKILIEKNLLHYIGFVNQEFLSSALDDKQFLKQNNIVNLAIIIKLCPKAQDELTILKKELKLSKREYKELHNLISFTEEEFTDWHHYKYIHKFGSQEYLQFLFIINNFFVLKKYHSYIELAESYKARKFPVNGRDLQKINIHGATIGETLQKLAHHWHQNQNSLSKKELLSYLK
jgi:poly(A) polymerase